MGQTDTRRRALVGAMMLIGIILLMVGVYLIFLRWHAPSKPPPAADAARVVAARPDAARPRADAPRADQASPDPPRGPAHAGAGRHTPAEPAEVPVAPAAKPDAAPPKPDAARPDARRKDAVRREPLPARPQSPKHKPARVVTQHQNRMGSSFVLIQLTYEIDGKAVYDRSDLSGGLDRTRDFEAFSGTLIPGRHNLVVRAVYRGSAHGVFKYHEGYRYRVRSEFGFTVNSGRRTQITVEALERGGATTKLADKPSFKFGYQSTADR